MKRLTLLLLLILFSTLNAQENNFKEFYKTHKKEAQVSFNVPLFLVKPFLNDEDLDEKILKKETNFKMLVYENKEGNIISDFEKFSKRNKFKTLLRSKNGKDKAEIYYIEEGHFIKEIILMAGSRDEEIVLMSLKTKRLTKEEMVTFISNKS